MIAVSCRSLFHYRNMAEFRVVYIMLFVFSDKFCDLLK